MCECGYLLCSVGDVLGQLIQPTFNLCSVCISLFGQRQRTHTLLALLTRWSALWWTQVLSVAAQRGAGLSEDRATHLPNTRLQEDEGVLRS